MEDQYQLQYVLNIKGKKFADELPVEWDQYTIGSSERSDLCIEDQKLAPIHVKFRIQNDVLTVTNLGGDKATSIGWQKLGHGKMYILDKGDKISLGNLKIQIAQEKVEYVSEEAIDDEFIDTEDELEDDEDIEEEIEEQIEEELVEEDDATDPNLSPMSAEELPELPEDEDLEDELENEEEEDEDQPRPLSKKLLSNTPQRKLDIDIKKKGKYTPKGPLPGPISRLSYILFNASLVLMMKFYFFHLLDLNQLWNDQWKNLSPLILGNITKYYPVAEPFIPKSINPFLKSPLLYELLVLYILSCILSGLIFGKSFGAFLGFCFSDGNAFIVRLKALFRGIFAVITAPFIIFDLPLLIGKRTLKEVLSGTRFYFPNGFVKIFSSPIVLLLTIVLFMSPLGVHFEQLEQNINVTEYNIVAVKNFSRKSKKRNKEIDNHSNFLNARIKSHISSNWSILPLLQANEKGTKLSLNIIDTQDDKNVSLQFNDNKESLNNLVLPWLNYDPLLEIFQKELYLALKQIEDKKIIKSSVISQSLIKSIKINKENAPFLPQDFGPFISYPLQLKKDIIQYWPELQSYQVSTFEKSNGHFIVMSNPKLIKVKVITGNKVKDIMIRPMEKSSKLARETLESFLAQLSFHNEKKEVSESTGWSRVLDIYAELSQSKPNERKLNKESSKFLSSHYLKLAKSAYSSDNYPLKTALIENIKSLDKALLFFIAQSKDSQLQEFRLTIIRIQKALSDGDANFFESNN